MRRYRPLTPAQEQVLAAYDLAQDQLREDVAREIYELEQHPVPLARLAAERALFKRLLRAARNNPVKSRALARVLERIPHASESLEWAKLAPEERNEQRVEALADQAPPST